MSDLTDWDITEAMCLYGGSFASGLGLLWHATDDENRHRLKAAFPQLFQKYHALALLKREQQEKHA